MTSNIPNKYLIESHIEKVGLSSAFPYDFIYEIIEQVLDNSQLLHLGIEGDICKTVRSLYYSGYNDLGPEKGVITLLRDIESVMNLDLIIEGEVKAEISNSIPAKVIDKNVYLQAINHTKNILATYSKPKKKKLKYITDLTPLQLAHPLFKLKFSKKEYVHYFKQKTAINTIALIEDGTHSMLYPLHIEKMIGISKGVMQSFSDSRIVKYTAYKHSIEEVELDYILDYYISGQFQLQRYLDKIIQCDLIIVCTDANLDEFQLREVTTPVVIFNVNKIKMYSNTNALTIINI